MSRHAPQVADLLSSGSRQQPAANPLRKPQCPTLICAAQDDPLSSTATAVYDGLTASKTLLQFTSADGAGDHCEMRNRALFNLRAFDWLEESLSASTRQPLTAGR